MPFFFQRQQGRCLNAYHEKKGVRCKRLTEAIIGLAAHLLRVTGLLVRRRGMTIWTRTHPFLSRLLTPSE